MVLSDDIADSQRQQLHPIFQSPVFEGSGSFVSISPVLFLFETNSYSGWIQQHKINMLHIEMAFHFTNSIKCTIFCRLQERDIQVIDLTAFITHTLSLCVSLTYILYKHPLVYTHSFLRSILIFLPTARFFPESYSRFIVCWIWGSWVVPKSFWE